MINAEDEIFAKCAEKIREAFPNAYVTGEYVRTPPRFPAVSIEEKNNAIWRNARDSSELENAAAVMYEVNVYSNLKDGKKREAKAILDVADSAMKEIGFSRTMVSPIPNLADATIYRLTARYSGIIGIYVDDGIFTIFKR